METISAKRLSKLLVNSLENTNHLALKPNRLSGEGLSYNEINTGRTKKGSIEKGRIQIGTNDAGELIIEDGRHLLHAYVNIELDIPIDQIAFTSDLAKTLFTEIMQ